MKTILFQLSILLCASLILNGCNKNEDPTKTELLCKAWKVISIDGPSTNQGLDIRLQFDSNGNFQMTTKYLNNTDTETGYWYWENSEQDVKLVSDTDELIIQVKKLTTEQFWFYLEQEESLYKCDPI